MHFQTALVIPIFAIGALATYMVEGSEFGLDSDLKAVPLAIGARVVNDVYTDCTEETDIDGQIIEGEECFAHALGYMIQILSDVHDSSQFVALLSNTVSGVQSGPANVSATGLAPLTAIAMPPKSKREDHNAMKAVLEDLNNHIRRRSEGQRRPGAVQIEHSNIHPTNGLAIRTNVHSGDTTLHVHTNGSHSIASFDKDDVSSLGRRDDESTSGSRFRFEGTQGLKLEVKTNEQAYGVLNGLLMELAYGKREMAPKLKESDSWALALCRGSDITLHGKLVAEDNGAGFDWEDVMIGCEA